MNTITRTALANLKQNKSRNILSGIAILLTTLLIFLILTVGYDSITVRFAGVNAYYPTYHVMFRQVSQENADALKSHADIETVGLREDFGEVVSGSSDTAIPMIAMDAQALTLNKVTLEEGSYPTKDNEIAVYRSMLDALNLQAELGSEVTLPFQLYEDGSKGYAQEDTFRISGFLDGSDTAEENNGYIVLTSMEYMENCIPESQREYRVMFRLADAEGMTSDAIEERSAEIGADFGVNEENIVSNNEYLAANYVDPAFLTGITAVIMIVILAGILTIYSIYYVSMIPKVQEYGKLKAMGAAKRQIRQIVFREGILVTAAALPAGLILGSLIAAPAVLAMHEMGEEIEGSGQTFNALCVELIRSGEITLLHWWIYLLTAAAVLLTVYLALVKPMRTAAKISPVEAMRYQGGQDGSKKQRKGCRSLNVFRLTKANLARNKKRTAITVATLSAVGVLFMVTATVISCADPRELARQEIESDYQISLDSWEGDKMNPDRSWSEIMKNNPLSDEFIQEIKSISGVEEVRTKTYLNGSLPELDPGDEIGGANVTGLDASYAEELENVLTDGHITYKELEKGDQIVMDTALLHWYPDLKIGDPIRISFDTADGPVEKTFRLAAMAEFSRGLASGRFILPTSVLEDICPYNLTDTCEITVDPDSKDDAYAALQAMADLNPYLSTNSYEECLSSWESSMAIISFAGYAFLIILGAIGVMNLINTMINSIYTRKHELGMIQAIGMSEKQLVRMMQAEGLFYTLGTLAVSLGLGSLAGYCVFLYAKAEGMLNITVFHYPVIQAVILAATVTVVQLLLTYGVSRSFRRLSLIERIRYSE